MSITTLIKTIQDIMRKDVGVDGDAQPKGVFSPYTCCHQHPVF